MIVLKIDSKNLYEVIEKIESLGLDISDSYVEKDMIALNEVFRKSLKRIDQEFFDRYIKSNLIDEIPYSEYRLWIKISSLKELREEYSLEIMDKILRREIFDMLSVEDLDIFAGFDILNILNNMEINYSFPLSTKDRFKITNNARSFLIENYEDSLWKIEELKNHIESLYLVKKDEILKKTNKNNIEEKIIEKKEDNSLKIENNLDIVDADVSDTPDIEIPDIPDVDFPDIPDVELPTDIMEDKKDNNKKKKTGNSVFRGRGKPNL